MQGTDFFSKQLDLYEESWKADHDDVRKGLWRFEDHLAIGLGLFRGLRERYWSWRVRVERGKEAYEASDGFAFRDRFVRWLGPCRLVAEQLDKLEAKYGSVAGADYFRRCCLEAQQLIANWSIPERQVSVPAHTDVSCGCQQLSKMLDERTKPAAESVPLKHTPDYTQVF